MGRQIWFNRLMMVAMLVLLGGYLWFEGTERELVEQRQRVREEVQSPNVLVREIYNASFANTSLIRTYISGYFFELTDAATEGEINLLQVAKNKRLDKLGFSALRHISPDKIDKLQSLLKRFQLVIYRKNALDQRYMRAIFAFNLPKSAYYPLTSLSELIRTEVDAPHYLSALDDAHQLSSDFAELISSIESQEVDRINADIQRYDNISNYLILSFILLFAIFVVSQYRSHKMLVEASKAVEVERNINTLKGRFLSNISHELRTPMNGVLGMSEVLVHDKNFPADYLEKVTIISKNARHMISLLNDILDEAKIISGRMPIENVNFSLHDVLDDIKGALKGFADDKKLSLTVDVNYDKIPKIIVGDPTRLRQILFNLIGNAIKFTEFGRVLIKVTRPSEHILLFEIEDTGIGIAEDKLNYIFERFSQVDESTTRKFGGTGLGLSISKSLVELMGGAIGASSRLGKGSTFWFQVPLIYPSEFERVNVANTQKLARSSLSPSINDVAVEQRIFNTAMTPLPKDAKLLIADDNDLNLIVLELLLSEVLPTAKIEKVSSGEAALERLERQHYDLFVTDIQMPDIAGNEIARMLREGECTSVNQHVIVVACTGQQVALAKHVDSYEAIDGFMTKPISMHDIKQLMLELGVKSH